MMISAIAGRRYLMGLLLLAFVFAFVTQLLLGWGGLVTEETSQKVITRFLKIFIPMLGIVGAFLFSEKGHPQDVSPQSTSIESFIFAATTVAIWSFLPTIALLISQTFEAALRLLDQFEAFGSTISIAGLTYYFSTSAPAKKNT